MGIGGEQNVIKDWNNLQTEIQNININTANTYDYIQIPQLKKQMCKN